MKMFISVVGCVFLFYGHVLAEEPEQAAVTVKALSTGNAPDESWMLYETSSPAKDGAKVYLATMGLEVADATRVAGPGSRKVIDAAYQAIKADKKRLEFFVSLGCPDGYISCGGGCCPRGCGCMASGGCFGPGC